MTSTSNVDAPERGRRAPGKTRFELIEPIVVGMIITVILLTRSLAGLMLVGALNDDGVYTVLGKAIAGGSGYVSLHLANHPVQEKFPPGFPLILALLWKLSGTVEGVQRLVAMLHPVVIGATSGLLYWIGRTRLGASRPLLCLFVLMPLVFDAAIQYYTIPLSEPWFMLAWAVVLALWEKGEQASSTNRLMLLAATGLATAFAVLTRTQGVVLIPALIVALAGRRFSGRDRVIAAGLMLIPLLAWKLYHRSIVKGGPLSLLPDEASYGTWAVGGAGAVKFVLGSIASNVATYSRWIGYYLAGIPSVGVIAAVALIGAMIVGSFAVIRRYPLLGISSVGALVIVALWPFAQDRLLLSVMPFCGLAAALWLSPLVMSWSGRWRRALSYGSAVCIALMLMRQADIRGEALAGVSSGEFLNYSATWRLLMNSRFIASASNVVKAKTDPSARLMIDNHSGIYLYTGRETTPASPAESQMQKSVFSVPGQYLASRILRDSLNYVIVAALTHPSAGVPTPGVVRDIALIRQQCAGVLTAPSSDPAILLVQRDDHCLSGIARGQSK